VDYLVKDSVCQKKPAYLHSGQIEIVNFLIYCMQKIKQPIHGKF